MKGKILSSVKSFTSFFIYSERNVPFQEQINLEVGGNDDGQGKDVELKVVHGVVDICPVSWAATE